jgi:hypothetical protein
MMFRFTKRKIGGRSAKRIMVSGLMFLGVVFFLFPQPVRADVWAANFAAAVMKQMLEKIARQIEGSLLGSLKMAAVQMLNQQVGQLIGGGTSGQARFIVNFNDFLYQGPAQRTELYMNDFFTMTTRGRGSSANYIGASGGNYSGYLESVGRQAIGGTQGEINLEEYTASPQTMFAEGDFRAFNAFFSNPYNNPFGYSLEVEKAYQNKLAMEQQAAAIKATAAGGYLPVEQNGMVITPAGSIQAAVTNIQNIPNQIIASATNPGEFLSGVVSAMANKVVTNLVQNGIGQVQSNIQREIGGVNSQVNSALKQATNLYGPAAPFTANILQRSVRVNSSTLPIPDNGTGGP